MSSLNKRDLKRQHSIARDPRRVDAAAKPPISNIQSLIPNLYFPLSSNTSIFFFASGTSGLPG
jgi:hypothetical protein